MQTYKSNLVWRLRFLLLAGCGIFALLFSRLTILMIVSGDSMRQRADANRIFTRPIPAPRGIIFDRNNIPLVANVPLYEKIEGDPTVLQAKLSPIDEHQAYSLLLNFPEQLFSSVQRTYPYGSALADVVGYLGYINPEVLRPGVMSDERVGKFGLERAFDQDLRGKSGNQEFERNALGKLTHLLAQDDASAGKDLKVTLDANLSKKAFELLNGRKGAVVVSAVASAQVLALVSSPGFNPSDIVPALSDANKPLLNRALQAYPPGSVFKMMTALAALKSGALKSDTLLRDEGEIKVGAAVFRNWYFTSYGRTEGDINVVRALSSSNDVFFYKAALATGPDSIASMAEAFHLSSKSGLGLFSEQAGTIPTPAWKEKVVGEKWYLGDTYHMGIGQGDVLVSPLALNAMTAAIARRGVWCAPVIILGLAPACNEIDVAKNDVETVVDGMVGACSPSGTAFPFFADNLAADVTGKVACKTGTAEHGAKNSQGLASTDAWLTMFYPSINPKVAITVMLESDGNTQFLEGSADAAPIAKGVLSAWKESHTN